MSTSNYLVPLTPTPQTFEILLAAIFYTLTVKWNDMAQCWFMDVADTNGNPLACGLPLVTGADLLDGLEYLGIDGELIVFTNGNMPDSIPTFTNLGTDSNVYFVTSNPNE